MMRIVSYSAELPPSSGPGRAARRRRRAQGRGGGDQGPYRRPDHRESVVLRTRQES